MRAIYVRGQSRTHAESDLYAIWDWDIFIEDDQAEFANLSQDHFRAAKATNTSHDFQPIKIIEGKNTTIFCELLGHQLSPGSLQSSQINQIRKELTDNCVRVSQDGNDICCPNNYYHISGNMMTGRRRRRKHHCCTATLGRWQLFMWS